MKKRLQNFNEIGVSELKLRQNKIKDPNWKSIATERKTAKSKQQKHEQNTFYKWDHLILLQSETCTVKIISDVRW